jgi:hypothetical protein
MYNYIVYCDIIYEENVTTRLRRRSRWLRCLRHELSSFVRTLDSWVRIPFNVWMPVYAFFCIFVVLCTGSDLATFN